MLRHILLDPPAARVPEPITMDHRSNLFVDDHLVVAARFVKRRVNRPRKQPGPVMHAQAAWEGQSPSMGPSFRGRGPTGSITRRETGRDRPRRLPPGARFWPHGGVPGHQFGGRTFNREPFQEAIVANTNILLDDHVDSHGIHVDQAEQDPSRRFKMVLCMGAEWRKGLTPAVSAGPGSASSDGTARPSHSIPGMTKLPRTRGWC